MNKEEVEKLSEIIRTVSYSKGIGQLEIELLGFCNRLLTQAEAEAEAEKKEVVKDCINEIKAREPDWGYEDKPELQTIMCCWHLRMQDARDNIKAKYLNNKENKQ